MTDSASKLINAYVQKILDDNPEIFENYLLNGVDDCSEIERALTKMIMNSVRVSTSISVQIIMNILEEEGIISINSDEKILLKNLLKIYTGT